MRFAIFGDVHANLEALQAVLEDAQAYGATHYVCTGDIVGYNADPQECVKLIRELGCPVVKGNHDEVASQDSNHTGFNPQAERAIKWTRQQLSPEDKLWLNGLPLTQTVADFTIVHATLDKPDKWGYVFNQLDATASFNFQKTQLCFYGHTHTPRAYMRDSAVKMVALEQLWIEPGKKYFVNVGSVGQPRDGDWRAAYCIYDSEEQIVELRRLEYDIMAANDKLIAAGLPHRLVLSEKAVD